MRKVAHHCLLLVFLLTSIGQFAYACVEMEELVSASVVCCCDAEIQQLDKTCPMDMGDRVGNSDSTSCCEIQYQVIASDGSPPDSSPPQSLKKPDLDFGDVPAVQSPLGTLWGLKNAGLFRLSPPTLPYFPPRQALFLLTQRLRI